MSPLTGEVGAGAPTSADASHLPCVSSHLGATCFASMSVELHKCQLSVSSHYNTLIVLKAQGHPTLGKEREDTSVYTHTHTHEHTLQAVYKHTRVHTELPFGDVPHAARVCSGRKTSLPQFLHQNRFCFSLLGSGVTWFTKIASLKAASLIGGMVSP